VLLCLALLRTIATKVNYLRKGAAR
jgi:hypothetical protein